jgi:transcriptional regulator
MGGKGHLRMLSWATDRNTVSPLYCVTDAPAQFIDATLSGIVAFEVTVTRLVGKFKASQHRPETERRAVVEALEAEGTCAADRPEVVREPTKSGGS